MLDSPSITDAKQHPAQKVLGCTTKRELMAQLAWVRIWMSYYIDLKKWDRGFQARFLSETWRDSSWILLS